MLIGEVKGSFLYLYSERGGRNICCICGELFPFHLLLSSSILLSRRRVESSWISCKMNFLFRAYKYFNIQQFKMFWTKKRPEAFWIRILKFCEPQVSIIIMYNVNQIFYEIRIIGNGKENHTTSGNKCVN